MSETDAEDVQSSDLIILETWEPNYEMKIRVKNKKLRAFRDPLDSIGLNAEFVLFDWQESSFFTCHYDVGLSFGTDSNESGEYTYETEFYVESEYLYELSSGGSEFKQLFGCERARTNDRIRFSGRFETTEDFLGYDPDYPVVNRYKLYVKVTRYRWHLAPLMKTVDESKEYSEKFSKLQQRLQDLENVVSPISLKKMLGELAKKIIKELEDDRTKQRIDKLNAEVVELRETEQNLLAQLQELEQNAQTQAQELKDEIEKLERSADNRKRQLEKRIEELEDQLKCSVCYDNPIDVVFIPCGHARICSKCIADSRRKKCMICKQTGNTHRFFL